MCAMQPAVMQPKHYEAVMCTMQPAVMQAKHYEAVMQASGRLGLISCCQIVEVVATDY